MRYCGTVAKVRFYVMPNAKQDTVAGEHAGAIKIKLRAPAVEGKANASLRRFLAERLRLAQRKIVLEQGEKSREKVVRIDDLSEAEVRRRLRAENAEHPTPNIEFRNLHWALDVER